jgi:hypothetical protein
MLTAAVRRTDGDVSPLIARRLDDAAKYRLAVYDDRRYALTRWGRSVARAVSPFA